MCINIRTLFCECQCQIASRNISMTADDMGPTYLQAWSGDVSCIAHVLPRQQRRSLTPIRFRNDQSSRVFQQWRASVWHNIALEFMWFGACDRGKCKLLLQYVSCCPEKKQFSTISSEVDYSLESFNHLLKPNNHSGRRSPIKTNNILRVDRCRWIEHVIWRAQCRWCKWRHMCSRPATNRADCRRSDSQENSRRRLLGNR